MLSALKQQPSHESEGSTPQAHTRSGRVRELGDSIVKSTTDVLATTLRVAPLPNTTDRNDALKSLAQERQGTPSAAQVAGAVMITHMGSGASGLRAEQRVKDAAFVGEVLNYQTQDPLNGSRRQSGGVTLPPAPEAQQELLLKERDGKLSDRLLRAANLCVMKDAREIALSHLSEPLQEQYWRDLKEYMSTKRQFEIAKQREMRGGEAAGKAPVPSALVRGVHKEATELASRENRKVIAGFSYEEKLEAVRELRHLPQREPSRSVLREILSQVRDSLETA